MDRNCLLEELRKYGIKNDVPNITDSNAKFLRDIIKIKKPKHCLEIGTANGFSSIHLGIELEKFDGKLVSIEFSPNSHGQALENIKNAGLTDTIRLVLGNALDEIPKLTDKYQFVFIDGMKKRSRDFLTLVWDKVDSGGVIMIDDVIKFKDKMITLYEYLEEEKINYNILPIDPDDGVMMIIKP